MTISPRLFKTPPHAPFALAAGLLAATLMLLVAAASASGETIDDVVAAAAPVAAEEAPVPTEQVPATSEEAETQVAPAPSAPVAEEPSEAQETAPSVTESIDDAVESSPVRQVSKLVKDVPQDSAARVLSAADRLPGVRTDPVRNLVDHVTRQAHHVATGALLHHNLTDSPLLHSLLLPTRLLPEATSRPDAVRISSSPLRSHSSSPQLAIWSPPQLIAAPGDIEADAAASRALERTDDGLGAPPSTTDADVTFSRAGADRGGSPAPPEVPLPAPESPGAVASGSGGPIFVPLAALLALLALVAAAALRRLREVPDFRPPTPFVCALERPG